MTSSKPLTSFSIDDILRKPVEKRSGGPSLPSLPSVSSGGMSPLCALQELTSKTFYGLELNLVRTAQGRAQEHFTHRMSSKKRRKSRTAFTHQQLFQLEKRFVCQQYLSPVERDGVARQLGITSSQVITWFQNRRAKRKRDVEEMQADVESLRNLRAHTLHTQETLHHTAPSSSADTHTDAGSQDQEETEVED